MTEQQLPEPVPFFDAIGRVAFTWAELETELGRLLVALLHTPMVEVLAAGQSFSVVHSHIKAVIDVPRGFEQHDVVRDRLSDEHRDRVRDILGRSTVLSRSRNDIVHALWAINQGTNENWSLRPRRHRMVMSVGDLRSFSIADMYAVADDIAALARDVTALGAEIEPRFYLATPFQITAATANMSEHGLRPAGPPGT